MGVAEQQAQEAASGVRPEKAQARGRALLNLKLRDSEGGLLGRTLLTLILNKVLIYQHCGRCPLLCCTLADHVGALHNTPASPGWSCNQPYAMCYNWLRSCVFAGVIKSMRLSPSVPWSASPRLNKSSAQMTALWHLSHPQHIAPWTQALAVL